MLPSLPPLYIGPQGGCAALGDGISKGGGGQGGKGLPCPPRQGGTPPPRVPNPRRMGGGPRGAPQPTKGWFPSTFSPRGPPGQVAPPGGPPGPFRWSRYNTDNPETFPVAETGLPIYNSSPPDHSGTSRDVRDLIRDSEQLSGFRIHISLQP